MKQSVIFILAALTIAFYNIAIGQDTTEIQAHTITKTRSFTEPENSVFTIVDEMPRYPNGEKALRDTFLKYMQYPVFEKENNIKGTVILKFVVTENGSIERVQVIKGISAGLDAEAVRLMRMIPSFIPGKQQGKQVKVAYVLPIMFRLPKY